MPLIKLLGSAPNQVSTNRNFGTMAWQDANGIQLGGGLIDNTAIGSVTPSTGVFTTLSGALNGTVGATTANTGAFTTVSATGVITSTLATGTAPFTIASTTNVPNLNASSLSGATFASPGAIGGTTASTGQFTTVGIGASPSTAQQLLIGGASQTASTTEYGINNIQTVQSAVTTSYYGYRTGLGTQATTFTLTTLSHFISQQGTFGSGSTITTQAGFHVGSNMSGAVNNYGYYGNLASASNTFNIYMAGTADNYMAGRLGIGTTSLSNGFFSVGGTQSLSQAMSYIGGTNTYAGNPYCFNITSTLTGTSATTSMFGVVINPNYTPAVGSTINAVYGLQNAPSLNSTITPTNWYGNITQLSFGASATGGTVTQIIAYGSVTPTFNASSTTGVTTYYGFNSANITGTANNAIGTVYGFYSNQAASNTGVTNNWNFYAGGTAPNFFNGDMRFNKTVTAAGTTGAQTISKNAGTVNFAAAATSLVVTNTLVTTSSIIICTVGTNDTTMKSVQAVAAAGSFTLYPSAAPTAETRVNFIVIN